MVARPIGSQGSRWRGGGIARGFFFYILRQPRYCVHHLIDGAAEFFRLFFTPRHIEGRPHVKKRREPPVCVVVSVHPGTAVSPQNITEARATVYTTCRFLAGTERHYGQFCLHKCYIAVYWIIYTCLAGRQLCCGDSRVYRDQLCEGRVRDPLTNIILYLSIRVCIE